MSGFLVYAPGKRAKRLSGVKQTDGIADPKEEQQQNFTDMEEKTLKVKIGVTTENIFPVIKQFLYSDHEIFLRELVANAVDASQKMKTLASNG